MTKSYINFLCRECLLVLFATMVRWESMAQDLPNAYLSGTQVNFVRTWTATAPEQDQDVLITRPLRDVKQSTQYIDGLGRLVETVVKKGSLPSSTNLPTDIVIPVIYDAYGREIDKFLPYPSTKNDGNYKFNPFIKQAAFYNDNANGPVKNQGETFYYTKMDFEASALERQVKTYPAGNSWVGAQRGTSIKYMNNTAADSVQIWNVAASGIFSRAGAYATGLLIKSVTQDERGMEIDEFKNNEGKLILKKTQLGGTAFVPPSTPYIGWLSTYYIYDDLGNLRCVVQPRGVELISSTWVLTDATILSEQCFLYNYDGRNRMIWKKIPGAGAVNMVYDSRDRPVMTQDANLAALSKWAVTLYDNLNRPLQTGLLSNTYAGIAGKTIAQIQLAASVTATPFTGYPFSAASTPALTYWEKLTSVHYDDYLSVPTGLTGTLNITNVKDPNFIMSYNTSPDYAQRVDLQAVQTIGLITWTQTEILGTASQYISQVNFYDEKGRQVQTQTLNQATGVDIITTQYDFAGKILRTHVLHQKSSIPVQSYQLGTKNTYDDLGRTIKIEKNINNVGFKQIASMEYDALGQINKKSLGINPANTSLPLEVVNYDYNIRGWLLGENRDFVKDLNSANYFGFDLGYDKNGSLGTYIPQYNGNISGTTWKSKGDNQKRKYDFTYDAINRLASAGFKQYVSGTGISAIFDKSAGIDFSVANLTYDANGNIVTMNQNGLKLNTSPFIDQLAYTYQANSNKLSKVLDAANDNTSILGDFKYDPSGKSASDYSYDANGNLKLDNNKKISSITYNYLNLPIVITVTGKGSITFTYDAAGNKQKKVTVDYSTPGKSVTTTTTYINGFVYESKSTSTTGGAAILDYTDVLQFTSHEEGRIRRKTNGIFAYDYFLKDHLGNVRMVLTEEQQTDIYPAATLETSNLAREQAYYSILAAQIKDKTVVTGLPAYVNHNIIPNNPQNATFDNANSAKVYVLNKNSQNIGLGITLRVMSGDKLDIYGKSYYFQNNTGGPAANTAVTTLNILTGLLGGPTAQATGIHGAVNPVQLNGITGTTSLINTLLGNQTTTNNLDTKIPKAFINYILFDEQFKSIGGGFAPLGAINELTDYGRTPSLHNIPVIKNGFVYIYCSNESPVDVFFDNLQIMQTRGPILEETHYYPFGLTMAGISSKAAGGMQNTYKFQEKNLNNAEFGDGSGLEIYDFGARIQDPQIGRWLQIDPLADQQIGTTPYANMGNNPLSFVDPTGASNEWVETGDDEMLWDDRVTSQELAQKYYGDAAIYRAAGYSYSSSKGNVTLGDDREFSLNGESKMAVNSTPSLSFGDKTINAIEDWFINTDFLVEGKAKISLGVQLGISGNLCGIQGKLEGGVQTFDMCEASYDVTELNGFAGASEQRAHNFIGMEGKFFSDKVRIGGKYDYTYQYYNSYYGPKMIDGTATNDWNLIVPFKNFGPKVNILGNLVAPQMKASATGQSTNGKNFYGVDVGASVKVLLGIDVKLKIGFNQ